jgi:hypothetical protein
VFSTSGSGCRNIKALQFLETPANIYPKTQHNFPEDLNKEQHEI